MMSVWFEIVGEIRSVKVIAVQNQIRELRRLEKAYGCARWRKLKGVAQVRLRDGSEISAEIHWYEAHGIGSREHKIKHLLS